MKGCSMRMVRLLHHDSSCPEQSQIIRLLGFYKIGNVNIAVQWSEFLLRNWDVVCRIFRRISHPLQANSGIVPWNRSQPLPSPSFHFVFNRISIRRCITYAVVTMTLHKWKPEKDVNACGDNCERNNLTSLIGSQLIYKYVGWCKRIV